MKIILGYLKEYRLRMAGGFLVKATGTVAELFLPLILSHILAEVITQTVGDIVFWGIMMSVCSVVAWILNITANRMAAKVAREFAEKVRKDLFSATLRLSASQTSAFTIPSLESRITTDTYNVHHFANMIQRLGVRAPIMLIGGIGITLFMDAKLALIMLAMLPLIGGVITFIRFRGIPLYSRVEESSDRMISVVREDAGGMRVIKALSKTEYEHKRFDRCNRTLVNDEIHTNVIMSSIHPLMSIFMNLGSIAVIGLGAVFVSKGTSEPETIIAFMQYFTLISNAMMSLTRFFVMFTKSAASAKRIGEVLSTTSPLAVCDTKDCPDKATDAHIVFDHVTFSYINKRNNLDNLSFSVRRGEHLGIIGATGSGKTTIISLLLRFYDVTDGAIYIGGKNIRTIEKNTLYRMFGSALQQDFLYADTIAENIRFGRQISDEDVKTAAILAQADDFITAFPEGYAHMLTPHGTNISGGQKQRILIARALAAKPEILLLDDSSSALDYKTDAALRTALARALDGTTVFTVAQRISSVKNCDHILVLEDGKTIGCGTHEELLASCPAYREISESQMGGAFVE